MKFEDLNLENVQTIEEGMVFKNRRHLSEFLGVEYTQRGSKSQKQLKQIDNIFSYHKEGNKFIVDHVYSLERIELGFKLSTDRQKKISEILILDLILGAIKNKDETLIINHNMLISSLALANKNYIYYHYNKQNQLMKKLNINKNNQKTLEVWLNSIRNSLKHTIESAIAQLEKESYIMHSKVFKVELVHQTNEINITENLNKYGDTVEDYSSQHSTISRGVRLATPSEVNAILDIEREILQKMKVDSKATLMQDGRYGDFLKGCRRLTLSRLSIGFYFLCYSFNFAENFIEEKKDALIEELQRSENIAGLKLELNSLMCERTRENSKRRQKRHKTIIDEGNKMFDDSQHGMLTGNLGKTELDKLFSEYTMELNKTYMDSKEHAEIENRLTDFLLLVENLQDDIQKTWHETLTDKEMTGHLA